MQGQGVIERFFHVLGDTPGAKPMRDLEADIAVDAGLKESWYDFLAEQYEAGTLPIGWQDHVESLPGFAQRLSWIRSVQDGVRELHEQGLREAAVTALPRLAPPEVPVISRMRRVYRWVAAAAITLAVVAALIYQRKDEGGAIAVAEPPVLMVEPFELEGVTEDMIVHGIPQRIPAKLASAPGIYTLSSYAVKKAQTRAAGQSVEAHLNADFVIRGSARQEGDGFVVFASLVSTKDQASLWQQQYHVRNSTQDLNNFHDDLAIQVAELLDTSLSTLENERLSRDISDNARAMTLFLAAERLWVERTADSLRQAIDLFELALQEDPGATAIRGYLALALATYVENDWGSQDDWHRATSIAQQVLREQPDNAEANIVLSGYVYTVEKDYEKALGFLNTALDAHPGDPKIHQAIAEVHLRSGRIEEGLTHIRVARILEPEHPVLRWVETKYLTATGQLEIAREAADDLMELYPNYPNIQNFYWQYYLSKGDYERALLAIPRYDTTYQWRTDYMVALTLIDQKNAAEFLPLYDTIAGHLRPSLDLLWNAQNDRWNEVYTELDTMLTAGRFHLLALFQTTDFAMFNKMKQDAEIGRILAKYGIRVHQIPDAAEEI